MSVDLMIAALRRGNNGNEILSILDAITGENDKSTEYVYAESPMIETVLGTLDPIVF